MTSPWRLTLSIHRLKSPDSCFPERLLDVRNSLYEKSGPAVGGTLRVCVCVGHERDWHSGLDEESAANVQRKPRFARLFDLQCLKENNSRK